MTTISVLAPAKVNLFLHIIGRREDGYHLLESLFAFANFGDKITVHESDDISFSVTGPFADICKIAKCDNMNNIAAHAAVGLKALSGVEKGAKIVLEKNIPLSAGLGGGSSDAAATLKALQILWDVEIDAEKLFPFALELGADIPACLIGELSFVTGIGEFITPLNNFQNLHCLLVNPNKPLSTRSVFKAYADNKALFSDPLGMSLDFNQDIWSLLSGTHNDLQAPATTLLPEIKEVLSAIKKQQGCQVARMSGSGATCFGIFKNEGDVTIAAKKIALEKPDWWVIDTQLSAMPRFLLHH